MLLMMMVMMTMMIATMVVVMAMMKVAMTTMRMNDYGDDDDDDDDGDDDIGAAAVYGYGGRGLRVDTRCYTLMKLTGDAGTVPTQVPLLRLSLLPCGISKRIV